MINKFEAVGIFISVACMVLALFLLRLETAPADVEILAEDSVAAVVIASDIEDKNTAVLAALLESADSTGTLSRLIIDDVVLGHGEEVQEGDSITVHYVGTLRSGQQFDNSYAKGEPFTFTVGAGRVIEGWEQGFLGMKTGGQRILVVPPSLAYGPRTTGPIPANATLVFAVELLEIN